MLIEDPDGIVPGFARVDHDGLTCLRGEFELLREDAALHVAIVASETPEVVLPFSWQRVSLHAAGASAVRARIAPAGPSAVSIELADGLGLPVLSVGAMVARPVTEHQLREAVSGSGSDRLFEVFWSPATTTATIGANPAPSYQLFESVAVEKDQ